MKRVVIHIDHLSLNGFRHEDRHAIAVGLQERLAQLFGERAVVAGLAAGAGREAPRLQAGNVRIEHGATPQRVGAHVAAAVSRGLQR
ncbi:MAG: hypothetical protein ABI624_08265 [Casimicrobiaceae bacterium]